MQQQLQCTCCYYKISASSPVQILADEGPNMKEKRNPAQASKQEQLQMHNNIGMTAVAIAATRSYL